MNTPTTSRGEQAKNQLIAAALDQFGEYGLHATTRDIAAAAGQNIAAISYYFGSKDDLYQACAKWIADFIEQHLAGYRLRANALLAETDVDRPAILALLHESTGQMVHLLTADETLNISRFISREQLSPTGAYHLIHQQVIEPLHQSFTGLIAAYTERNPADTEMILHAHSIVGEVLTFRLMRETVLLRTGWQQFDEPKTRQIAAVIHQHIDFILQGLSAQRGTVSDEE